MRGIQRFVSAYPRRARVLAVGAAVGVVALLLARANPMHLIFLQDHPLSVSGALVPANLLLFLTFVLLLPSSRGGWPEASREAEPAAGRRIGPVAFLAGAAVLMLYCGGALALETPDALVRRGHDLAGDVYTPDGRYELRVFHWDYYGAGEDEWEVLVERRGAIQFLAVDAGCLSETVTSYRGVVSFEAGHASLATDGGAVDIEFDPRTMRVTTPLPAELCPDD